MGRDAGILMGWRVDIADGVCGDVSHSVGTYVRRARGEVGSLVRWLGVLIACVC